MMACQGISGLRLLKCLLEEYSSVQLMCDVYMVYSKKERLPSSCERSNSLINY